MLRSYLTRTVQSLAAALFAFTVAAPSQASTLQMDTRYYTGPALASAAAYQSTIDALANQAATSGYGSTSLNNFNAVSNQSVFGSSGNVAFRYTVNFNASSAGNWNFRIGPDFGLGGAVFLDGQVMGFRSSDMWWAGSYATTTQDFEFGASLAAGNHTLAVYGLEACCDGSQQAQFQAPNASGFTSFSVADGHNPNAVPEPGSLSLIAVAGLGMVGLRRRFAA